MFKKNTHRDKSAWSKYIPGTRSPTCVNFGFVDVGSSPGKPYKRFSLPFIFVAFVFLGGTLWYCSLHDQSAPRIRFVRPILTPLDLQSVQVPFSTFARVFAPKMLEIGLPRPRMTWLGVFSKMYPELCPPSPGAQLQEITVSTFFIQLRQIRLQKKI